MSEIDLYGANIASDLSLEDASWFCRADPDPEATPTRWPLGDKERTIDNCNPDSLPKLTLRGARIGTLQYTANGWPPEVDLVGFRYDRVSGFDPRGSDDIGVWRDWLGRNRPFNTEPYIQLASVFKKLDHPSMSDTIKYFAREDERKTTRGLEWVALSAEGAVFGYKIGDYAFRVLWWMAPVLFAGAVVLGYSPAGRRGWIWRVAATLHCLVPILKLSKEFDNFFDNPEPADPSKPRNLSGIQVAFFAYIAFLGWLVGIFLAAAFSGLTGKS